MVSIEVVAPLISPDSPKVTAEGEELYLDNVNGTTPDYERIDSVKVEQGRFFNHTDNQYRRAVAVVGADIATTFWPNRNPIGKRFNIDNNEVEVIGVLEGRVLYVCKYFMARGHWQIARHYGSGNSRSGRVEAVPLDRAPAEVTRLALESTGLIGNGLYGVDVKETESGPVLIEINDNPNVERGDEDFAEGERLYDAIIGCFARRIDLASRASQSPSDAA